MTLDRTKLLAARFKAANDRPYFATALFSLTVIESPEAQTMGVDKHWRCYVSPSFVDRTPVPELAGVWIHEIGHLLRDHHGRSALLPETDRRDWPRVNIAQDCEINDDLLADHVSLPDGGFHPGTFGLPDGQMFEQYLPHIPPTPHVPNCGSGAHGSAQPWELGGTGTTGVSEVEAAAIRRQTAEGIRQHVRSRGTIANGWKRWADEVLEPTIDWRRALTGAVREAAAWASGAVDYTFQRPSRRNAALPRVVLPRLRQPVPRVAIVIDTSGSMSADDLAEVLGEVSGVLRAVGIGGNRVNVLACDADVHTARAVSSVREVELAGGGGTDMRVGIGQAMKRPDPPHIVVVLTDGYTPWPEAPFASTRVIAGLVGDNPPAPPAWISAIRIKPS